MPETPPTFDEIVAYLRRHGAAFSRDALEEQLRQGGAEVATIERAFLTWEDEVLALDKALAVPTAPPPRRPLAWPWSLALAAVSVLITWAWIQQGIAHRDRRSLLLLGRSLIPGFWLAELVLGLVLIKLSPRWSRVLLLAALWHLLLGVAALLLALGFCVWLFAQMARGHH